MHDKLIK